MALTPFHLAIPVHNLKISRDFYTNTLNLEEGRSSDHWVDYNFFGHQLVIHYKENEVNETITNSVDGKAVPVPHFGVVLEWEAFQEFAELLKSKDITFIIEPYIRFEGLVGEQVTMFFKDPSGNALEFKAFKDINQLFAK
ncbi:Glyoxalase/bleomycin resistance protein/dioxygenase [Winogradskyella psychrotolerans RS-3]|uniref:Glyoxalase/bleomycin resistance protein/dioxygenase n=1 Tax=Winogradskyella psychrotolerans RS-3 TaxID=641526 RepID=S7VIU2_9FLAO|nr:Glyoxalase/bleomycin resistance protein/dioxygenase [Winogradskyella psychrotolerans RS-3]